MRLAALYSGGKDSTFSLYLASQMGHEIPYLVTVVPVNSESWIFHVPNISTVPAMAESMGIPLISVETDGTEEGDMDALRSALKDLDIDGIITGAVWSDYQWSRMNSICGELDLFVLSPLWRKDQDMILDDMVASGVEAVIIGCYAEGFDESWLGREINAETVKELKDLRQRYGISIMGEGGEYESMTLDSPMFSYPLCIDTSENEWSRNNGSCRVTLRRA